MITLLIRYENEAILMDTTQLLNISHCIDEIDAVNKFTEEIKGMLERGEIYTDVALKMVNDMILHKHVYYTNLEYEIRTIPSRNYSK